ncbi:MAG: sialidase family protein, partial [Verrucomicrobiota bacterium]
MNELQTKAESPEPTLGSYTVIYDHYAEIPMQFGRLITDAPSLVRTRDGALLCADPIIINHQGNKGLPKDPLRPLLFFRSEDDGRSWEKLDAASDFCCGTMFRHGDAL